MNIVKLIFGILGFGISVFLFLILFLDMDGMNFFSTNAEIALTYIATFVIFMCSVFTLESSIRGFQRDH